MSIAEKSKNKKNRVRGVGRKATYTKIDKGVRVYDTSIGRVELKDYYNKEVELEGVLTVKYDKICRKPVLIKRCKINKDSSKELDHIWLKLTAKEQVKLHGVDIGSVVRIKGRVDKYKANVDDLDYKYGIVNVTVL